VKICDLEAYLTAVFSRFPDCYEIKLHEHKLICDRWRRLALLCSQQSSQNTI